MKAIVLLLCFVSLSLARGLLPKLPLTGGGVLQKAKRENPMYACPVYTCAGENQICGYSKNSNSDVVAETDCNDGLVCNYTSTSATQYFGTCVPLGTTPGSPCVEGVCGGGLTCHISNNTCYASPSYGYPGDTCVSIDYCFYYSGFANCTNGICPFVPVNQSCNESYNQCNEHNAYCSASTFLCTPLSPNGTNCTVYDNSAAPATVARTLVEYNCQEDCLPKSVNSTQGYCGTFYSVAEGQPCSSDEHCKPGLFCNYTGDYYNGVCTSVKQTATLYQPCSVDANCTADNNEWCGCMRNVPTPVCVPPSYPAQVVQQAIAIYDCGAQNGCDLNEPLGTCVLSKCLPQICAGISAILNVSDDDECRFISIVTPLCAALPTKAPTSPPTSSTSSTSATSAKSSTTSPSSSKSSTSSSSPSTTSPSGSESPANSAVSISLFSTFSLIVMLFVLQLGC